VPACCALAPATVLFSYLLLFLRQISFADPTCCYQPTSCLCPPRPNTALHLCPPHPALTVTTLAPAIYLPAFSITPTLSCAQLPTALAGSTTHPLLGVTSLVQLPATDQSACAGCHLSLQPLFLPPVLLDWISQFSSRVTAPHCIAQPFSASCHMRQQVWGVELAGSGR